jgi:hypothetical protein
VSVQLAEPATEGLEERPACDINVRRRAVSDTLLRPSRLVVRAASYHRESRHKDFALNIGDAMDDC